LFLCVCVCVCVCAVAVETCDECLAMCERKWRTPYQVVGWREAVGFDDFQQKDMLESRFKQECTILDKEIAIQNQELDKNTAAFDRKITAAKKTEKLTLREARIGQATREYEERSTYLIDRIGEMEGRRAALNNNVPKPSTIAEVARQGNHIELRKQMKKEKRAPSMREVEAALAGGSPMVMDILLQCGANVRERNGHGSTLLHQACHQGQQEIVSMLLEYECDINARNSKGQSPLHLACCSYSRYRKAAIVRMLLESGADTALCDKWGHTPLWYVENKSKCTTSATLLSKAGVLS